MESHNSLVFANLYGQATHREISGTMSGGISRGIRDLRGGSFGRCLGGSASHGGMSETMFWGSPWFSP